MKNCAGIHLLSWVIVFVLCAHGAWAEGKNSHDFPAEINKEGYVFKLQGSGFKTVLFMKAFVAGFYLPEGVTSEDRLTDVPKHLDVKYFTRIPAKALTDYTIARMKLNVSRQEFESLKKEIQLMGKYFVDLKPSDHFSLTYIPKVGTQFAHNGKETGVIAGEEFGRALFAVWVGAKPFDRNLKQKILGLTQVSADVVVDPKEDV